MSAAAATTVVGRLFRSAPGSRGPSSATPGPVQRRQRAGVNVTPAGPLGCRDGGAMAARPVRSSSFGDPRAENLVCRLFGHDPSLADPSRCLCGAEVDPSTTTSTEG